MCRIAELANMLGELSEAANDTINQNFVRLLSEYKAIHQRALEDLIDLFAKASATNQGTDSKWESRISRLRSDYRDLFFRASDGVMMPAAHQLFWTQTLDTEERFFDSLSRIAAPKKMDELFTHQNALSETYGKLDDTWTFLLSKNDDLKNNQMRLLQDLDQVVQGAISTLVSNRDGILDNSQRLMNAMEHKASDFTSWFKQLGGGAGEFVLEATKKWLIDEYIKPDGAPDEIDDPAKQMIEQAKQSYEVITEAARKRREALASYRDLVSTQKGSVLTMVSEIRKSLDATLRTSGISAAQTILDAAKASLDSWISGISTSGQQGDARSFRDQLNQKMDIVFLRTQNIDSQFKAKYQGALFSSLSSDTVETLAQQYLFKQQIDRIKDRELAKKLEEMQNRFPTVSREIYDKLDDMQKKMVSADALPSDVQAVVKSMTDGFKDYVKERIKTQIEKLLPAVDELRQTMTPNVLDESFGRQELESMLN